MPPPHDSSCCLGEILLHLFRASADGFSLIESEISKVLAEAMLSQTGHRPSASEQKSWANSLPTLHRDLLDAGLHKVEMLLEYRLPLSSKRADVVLAGHHPKTGAPSYVVIELKQWSSAERFEDSETLVRVDAYGNRGVTHPAIQVGAYCDYIADFTQVLADQPHSLVGAAYLHNATDNGVNDLFAYVGTERERIFTGQRRGSFIEFLLTYLSPTESGAQAADALLGSGIAPSRQLLSVAAEEVQQRERFVLLDEQRDAYEHVLQAVARARRADTKTAIVVTGGPGSGKSVIALSLLGALSREGRSVMHATGSRAFTQTMRQVAGRRAPRVQKMFAYFNSFMDSEPNDLDCLILDEAHRIRETSVNRYTRSALRAVARPQVDELLSAAKVPVFLLDEYQVVRPGELGTVADIEQHALARGLRVEKIALDAQFRCGGSEAYIQWVLRLLGIDPQGPDAWTSDGAFDVQVSCSPAEMESALETLHNQGYTARMAAGFCWAWSDPKPDGSLIADVTVGDWQRPWNLKGDRAIGGAPPSSLWASDPAGFGQVGCVYTAQGFEYDHAGVIMGPDLVWRDGNWVSVRSASKDPDMRSTNKVSDEDFDRLVKNVYKVLLTRGMQSVRIHSVDPETQAFLASLAPTP